MFADPITITIDGVGHTLARTGINGSQATYTNMDQTVKATISHTRSKKRIRSMVRVDQRFMVTNPLNEENDYDTLTYYSVSDRPETGIEAGDVGQLTLGFNTFTGDATTRSKLYATEF